MRRILLGGLGLAFGVWTPNALAQQPAFTNAQPTRAAKLGKPSVVADSPSPSDPAVTPAGLFRNGPAQQVVTYAPGNLGPPTPVITQPPSVSTPIPTPMPMPMGTDAPPMAQPLPGIPLPSPRPMPDGPPMVTESRDPTGRIPTGVLVPSVMPDDIACPQPCLEDPLCTLPTAFGRQGSWGNGRNWLSAELLLWWNRSSQVPPLVTTSSPQFNGIPGQGDTQVLLGGSFGNTFHVGGRVGGGHWFDDNQCQGFDWRVFWLSPTTTSYTATVPPYTLLARPFFNTDPNIANVPFGQSAEVVAGPGVANGFVKVTMKDTLWGAEANYRSSLWRNETARLDFLLGYRYLDLQDTLTIVEGFNRVPGSDFNIGTPAQSGIIADQFRTTNQFHGGQIGLVGTIQRGRWSLNARSSIAFGTVFQSADISGAQSLMFPNGTVQTSPGGLLAVPGANIGHWTQSRFAVVPEVGLNFGYQLTSRLQLFVGYNFLYLSSALRPGGVIDPNVDAARVPNLLPAGAATPVTPVHPVPLMNPTGYFIQGINFGLVYRW